MMKRVVATELLNSWIETNSPSAVAKLAIKAEVSVSLIQLARDGRVPGRPRNRRLLAKAINVSEDDLFPLVEPLADGSTDVAS